MLARLFTCNQHRVALLIPLPVFICGGAVAAEFNTSLLVGSAINSDWSNSNKVAPGIYNFDLYINNSWIGKFDFLVGTDNLIQVRKQDIPLLPVTGIDLSNDDHLEWVQVSSLLHGGNIHFDTSRLRIELSIPQAFILKKDAQWVAPEKWDEGINGLYTGYNVSYSHGWQKNPRQQFDNIFMTLRSGINLKTWHLIDNSIYSKNNYQKEGRWTSNERYLEKAIPAIKSSLRVGNSFTNSDVFDNIRFEGVSLTQEQKMYPDSYITYMPVIRGVAKGNATVRVYQNGNIVYQLNVPPGPFQISDMMPTGSRSDLNVIIEESDGSSQSFTVLYSTDAQMLRSGTSQWAFNIGKVNLQNMSYRPEFLQGNFSYGLNNYLTFLSGITFSSDYRSFLLGGAVAIPALGSVSLTRDSAYIDSQIDINSFEPVSGNKYKISWSKYFPSGTNISVSNSISDNNNYISFYDYILQRSFISSYSSRYQSAREKNNFNLNIDQVLPEGWGRLSFQGARKSFWNTDKKTTDYSFSYNNYIRNIAYTITASKTFYDYNVENSAYYGPRESSENQISFSVSIPFSVFDRTVSLSSSMIANNGSYASSSTSISSSSESTDYNLSINNERNGNKVTGSAYGGWKSPYSRITANYSESQNYRQAGGSASGTLLLWRKGILASSESGNTFVVLEAPGAVNATVNSNKNYKMNASGEVLIPSASAYRMNSYQVSESDKNNVVIMDNIRHTAPWFRSISYVKYKTDTRKTFTYSAVTLDKQPLPFGAKVLDKNKRETGYVAQGSQLYVKAEYPPSIIYVQMANSAENKTCAIKNPSEGESFENICRFY